MGKKNFFYLQKCRCCGNKKLKKILDLGKQPLANNLIDKEKQKVNFYPLQLNYCLNCHNSQLSICINPKILFNKYLYLSSISNTFKNHFKNAAKKYIQHVNLQKNSLVIDIGSNDGVGLMPFKKMGYKNILGIEPAKNLVNISRKKGIKTLNGFFDKKIIKKIKLKADLILASNVFAHSNDLNDMAKSMLEILSDKGSIIIEVQYLLRTIEDLTFDNIYHEHYNYWSLTSLIFFFKKYNALIYKAEIIDTHGGSIRVYITKDKTRSADKNIKKILQKEDRFGLNKLKRYRKFATDVKNLKKNVNLNINRIIKKYKKIIFYGAPAKATTLLNYYEIKNKSAFIVEDNKLKQGKILPGVNFPIYSPKTLKEKSEIIIILAWNFAKEISLKNKNISKRFISIKSLEKKIINF